MAKRILSLFLLSVFLLPCFSSTIFAEDLSYGEVPIYIGAANADYMADQILKEIDTAGKSDKEKIRAVYDWIILHCERSEADDTRIMYSSDEIEKIVDPDYYEKITTDMANGRIVEHLGMTWNRKESIPFGRGYWKSEVAGFAHKMMVDRAGNCKHFSYLLTLLLGHLGYDCRVLTGYFINNDGSKYSHDWNYVLVNDKYIWMDVRMDHANYKRTGKITYTYFWVEDTDVWEKKHEWNRNHSDFLAANAKDIAAAYASVTKENELRYSDWAETYIQAAEKDKMIPPFWETADLTKEITRKEFAAVAVKLYEELSGKSVTYPDENDLIMFWDNPFIDTDDRDVLVAYELGIVNGVGEYKFAPNSVLSREQAITMLGRVCELVKTGSIADGTDLKKGKAEIPEFLDEASISGWAAPYVKYFISHGVVNGVGNDLFAPTQKMTREQALKVAVGADEIQK